MTLFKSLLSTIAEYKVVVESPMKIGKMGMNQLEDNTENYAFTLQIKQKISDSQIDTLGAYKVYSYNVGNVVYDLFIDGDYTIALFSYITEGNRMIERKVWQEGSQVGLCRKIIFDYYLKKFDEIISDGLHTEIGEKYWKKLVKDAVKNGYIVSLLISGQYQPIDLNMVDSYFSHSPTSQNIRFSIKHHE